MKDELISFDTAVLAQKEGFHINVFDINSNELVYLKDGTVHKLEPIDVLPSNKHILDNIYCHAPTQSLLQRWLREVHNIHISIDYGELSNKYMGMINRIKNRYVIDLECIYKTYEEALEIGLQEALKLIK